MVQWIFSGFWNDSARGKRDGKTVTTIPTEEYFQRVRQQLSETGQAYVRVTGISMQPLLHHLRDGVAIVPPDKIRSGDIVLFDRQNGRYALHRVIRTGRNGFTMAGDNQWHMETGLPYGQVIGVVSRIQRNGKWIPCTNFGLRFYSRMVTILAYPRIYLRRILAKAGKLLHLTGKKNREGER